MSKDVVKEMKDGASANNDKKQLTINDRLLTHHYPIPA